jgi:hypothetical protein
MPGMGISNIIAGVSVLLTGLMPFGCHKTTATAPKTSPATIIVSPTSKPQHDLGEVALTNHLETCLQLGGGKNCTLTPRMLDKHTMEITLALESKTATGRTHDVSVTQVTAQSGKPLEIAVGDFQLSLTPNVFSE